MRQVWSERAPQKLCPKRRGKTKEQTPDQAERASATACCPRFPQKSEPLRKGSLRKIATKTHGSSLAGPGTREELRWRERPVASPSPAATDQRRTGANKSANAVLSKKAGEGSANSMKSIRVARPNLGHSLSPPHLVPEGEGREPFADLRHHGLALSLGHT